MLTPAHDRVLAVIQRRTRNPEKKRLIADVRGELQYQAEKQATTETPRHQGRDRK